MCISSRLQVAADHCMVELLPATGCARRHDRRYATRRAVHYRAPLCVAADCRQLVGGHAAPQGSCKFGENCLPLLLVADAGSKEIGEM